MNYNIFSSTAPAMPKPGKGTEFVKLALSQASKDMREVLIPMAIPALAAHLTDVRFMYCDEGENIAEAIYKEAAIAKDAIVDYQMKR